VIADVLTRIGFRRRTDARLRRQSQRTLKWAESVEHHRRTKHIDVRFRFLRDFVENGSFKVEYVSTDDNVMKALFKQRFKRLRSLMGLIMHN